jgi:hypothetical protein
VDAPLAQQAPRPRALTPSPGRPGGHHRRSVRRVAIAAKGRGATGPGRSAAPTRPASRIDTATSERSRPSRSDLVEMRSRE